MPESQEIEKIFHSKKQKTVSSATASQGQERGPLKKYVEDLVAHANAAEITSNKYLREMLAQSLVDAFSLEDLEKHLQRIREEGPGGTHKLSNSPMIQEYVEPDTAIEINRN